MFPSSNYGDRRGRTVAIVIAVVAAIVAAGLVAVIVVRRHHDPQQQSPAGAQAVQIPAADAATLSALMLRPKGSAHVPLLVMPAAWTASATQYAKALPKLVAHGFEVITYAQRGVGGSTGTVDFAGPATQRDVSTVIDWAIANTAVDASHISVMGVSAGATASLLAAEKDPRIKAVAALSGTTDLDETFAPNGAIATFALATLLGSDKVTGNLSPDVAALLADVKDGNADAAAAALKVVAQQRSAQNDVAALNRNGTAVMLANGYQDSFLPPADLLRFYAALTGPKRLQLGPGDHGLPEYSGAILGLPNAVWDAATAWVERYGAGKAAVQGADPGVVLTDAADAGVHRYPDLAAISSRNESLYLSAGGALSPSPATGWTRPVQMGAASVAETPPSMQFTIGRVQTAQVGQPPAVQWLGAAVSRPSTVNGIVTLRATVTSTTSAVGFAAYLYDVGTNGTSQLMTYAPVRQPAVAGTAQQVDLQFQPTSWTLAAGHHVALILDGADQRFTLLPTQGTVTFDATRSAAVLTLPLAGS
ncbi:MAG: hypothetical protein QOE97_331 [Pseudonocardiales bacterium]|nr:hypothetical protein [Pseudonocardiales bacterium]